MGNPKLEALPPMRIVNRLGYALRVPALSNRTVDAGEEVEVPGWLGWSLCRGGMSMDMDPTPTISADFWPVAEADFATFRVAELFDRERLARWADHPLEVRSAGWVARCPVCRHLLARLDVKRVPTLTRDCAGWLASDDQGGDLFIDGDALECVVCSASRPVAYKFSYPRASPKVR